jgi:hypothetical protein
MKQSIAALASVIALAAAVPAFSQSGQEMQAPQKDECLLYAQNCSGGQVFDIQTRISTLEHEIAKGTRVYTPDELQILRQRLNDANMMLQDAMKGGV